MRISDSTHFPHPILSPFSDDYKSGSFDISVAYHLESEGGSVRIGFETTITEPNIKELLEQGTVRCGVYVECLETYFTRLIPLKFGADEIRFQPGELLGLVTFLPVVWSTISLENMRFDSWHEEYGSGPISLKNAAILAVGEERRVQALRPKLAPAETIFDLSSAQLQSGRMMLDLEGDIAVIMIAEDVYESVNQLRELSHGKGIVFNSVYLPALMSLLSALQSDLGAYEAKRWCKVILGQCERLGIELGKADIWSAAQLLLRSPFLQIHTNRELLGG